MPIKVPANEIDGRETSVEPFHASPQKLLGYMVWEATLWHYPIRLIWGGSLWCFNLYENIFLLFWYNST